jgi:predicted amidohydrolase YtcJ
MTDLLLRNARFFDGGDPVDLRLSAGRIAEIAPAGGLTASTDTASADTASIDTLDLEGRFVGPGLWDAHVHFTQWVITQRRVDLGATTSARDVIRVVAEARAGRFPLTNGVLMGYGYRDGTWPDATSLDALDAAFPDVPVVLVNGDLHSAWMNRLGAARFELSPDASGVVAETEWIGSLQRFQSAAEIPIDAFRDAADAAAARGVVGIVEYENVSNVDEWPSRVAAGVRALRVETSTWPSRLDDVIARGIRTGDALDEHGLVRMGTLKVVTDGSLNTRTAYCWDPYPGYDRHDAHGCGVLSVPIPELRDLMQRAAAAGIGAAIHAIGDRANTETLNVFEELGLPGIIEHAQLVRADDFARFARLGLIASVQPEHAMDDRDVADRYWPGRTDRAFAFGSLLAAGVRLRLGSDAPVAFLDPWHAIASAVSRSRGAREAWHPEQSIPLDVALAASTRHPVAVGEPADLVVTDADPYTLERDALRTMPVAATLLGGRFTHRAF